MAADLTITYPGPSTASEEAVQLAAPPEPGVFFDGFVEHPVPAARAILCVADVAATRYFMPSAMLARLMDPVVTTDGDGVRFESFSSCAGVHARVDLLRDGLNTRRCSPGTTNVDLNPETQQVLSRITRRDPLALTIGSESVEVRTLGVSAIERRVPLPERWVKGFGEVQLALRSARQLLELDRTQTQRFLNNLPGGHEGRVTVWAVPTRHSAPRITTKRQPGAVCVAGTGRLRLLQPLARYADSLHAYGDPEATHPTATAWVVSIPGGRLSLHSSPDISRGFSGEGGLLFDLVSYYAGQDAAVVGTAIQNSARFSLEQAAARANLPVARTTRALTWMGIHGQIGYDVAEQTYFKRPLPFPNEILRTDPPRRRDAKAIAKEGLAERVSEHTWKIYSGSSEYRSTLNWDGFCGTCPWGARHGTSRGPCKHVLVAAITASEDIATH